MLLGANNRQLALGVRVVLKDQFSGPTRRMSAALAGYRKEFAQVQTTLTNTRNIALGVTTAGVAALRGLSSMVQSGAEFLYTMKSVQAITRGTTSSLTDLTKVAKQLSLRTIFDPREIASGMRFMAMAGQSMIKIKATIADAANLAGATMTPLAGKGGAADILTNAQKAFDWSGKDSTQIADVLTKAVTSANVSLVDLGNSIRYVAATSRSLKIIPEETIAQIMALGNAGIQGSMAGTAIENSMRYIAASLGSGATKKSKAAWAQLGLSKKDILTTTGDLLPMWEILGKIKSRMVDLGSIEQQNILQAIFGVRGKRAGATLLNNLGEVKRFYESLTDPSTSGTAAGTMAMMMDTLLGDIKILGDSFSVLGVTITEALGPQLHSFLTGLSSILQGVTKFIETPVGSFLTKVAVGIIAVTTALGGLALVVSQLRKLRIGAANYIGALAQTGAVPSMAGLVTPFTGYPRGPASGPSSSLTSGPHGPYWGRMNRSYDSYAANGLKSYNKRVIPVQPLLTPMRGVSSKLPKIVGGVSKLARVGKGLLGILGGPWGIAITGISLALPYIIDVFSGNSEATKENTRALRETKLDFKMGQLYTLIQGMSVAGATQRLVELAEAQLLLSADNGEALREAIRQGDTDAMLANMEVDVTVGKF